MKTTTIFTFFLLLIAAAHAQQSIISKDFINEVNEVKVTPPEFTGIAGTAANTLIVNNASLINKYLKDNLTYPEDARECNFQGTEVVQFTVNRNGELTNFKVVNSICPLIDEEMIKILQTTDGLWKPGLNNGKSVEMEKEVSMIFFIANDEHDSAIEIFRDYATRYFSRGSKLLLNKNKPRKALNNFNKAMIYMPYDQALLFARGIAKYNLDDKAGAEEDWERLNRLAENGYIDNNLELITENYQHMDGYQQYRTISGRK